MNSKDADIPDFDAFFVNGCFQSLATTRMLNAALKMRYHIIEENHGLGPLDRGFSYCFDEPFDGV